jgi:glycosyltransferase involved in cell wall biosynthesis
LSGQITVALLTLGDPAQITGGYLYHQRVARLAPLHGARVLFLSYPRRPTLLPALATPVLLRKAQAIGAHAVVLDSIAAPYLGLWPRLTLDIPLLAILHQPPGGVDHGPLRRVIEAPLDRRAYNHAALLMPASGYLADRLRSGGVDPARLRVVPPGSDLPMPSRPATNLRRGRHVALLSVGNWVPHKGTLELLAAFSQLPQRAATLHLAGAPVDRAYAARVRAALSAPDLADRVVDHGPLSSEGVAALYAAADVFVLPAYRETYGTVFAEALAFGLPIVGWRAGNLPYLIGEGREGLMTEPGDRQGLEDALQRIVEDDALRERLAQGAARRGATLPTWEDTTRQFIDAVRQVV